MARRKAPLRYSISLNDEQKEIFKEIKDNDISVITGRAGSGKTLLAVMYAIDKLFRKEIEKIIITRPTVSREEIGYLPGDIKEKLDPWLQPIYHNMNMCVVNSVEKKKNLQKYIEEGEKIEIAPISFMRGRTFLRSIVIVDEAQNLTRDQMEMVVGRLGKHSQMIICGDMGQVDLKKHLKSGLGFLQKLGENVEGFKSYYLTKNHRHPIVEKLLGKIEEEKDE